MDGGGPVYSFLICRKMKFLEMLSTDLLRGVLLNTLVNIELRGVDKPFKHKKNNEIKIAPVREMTCGGP